MLTGVMVFVFSIQPGTLKFQPNNKVVIENSEYKENIML
jgi:hypothetical protein